MEKRFNNGVRVIFQEPDGLYEVAGKMITEEQVQKLIALMECRWIIIRWAKPPVGGNRKSESTLPNLTKTSKPVIHDN